MIYNITWDSVPDFDDWGWDDYWVCSDWVNWHKEMKRVKGKSYADETFLKYWWQQTEFASPIDCRSFNSAFRDYFSSENLLDALYNNSLVKIIGAGNDVIDSGTGAISNTAQGIEKFTAVLKWLIPIVALLLLASIGYWSYKKYLK